MVSNQWIQLYREMSIRRRILLRLSVDSAILVVDSLLGDKVQV